MRRRMIFRRAMALTTIVALSGCNPYVTLEHPTPSNTAGAARKYTLDEGFAYADSARAKYRKKVADAAVLTNSLGGSVITLATAVTALAAFKADDDAILGAALLGGTGYTFGGWFANKQRDLVYIAGMEAMNCAVAAVSPLRMSDAAQKEFASDLSALKTALDEVETKRSELANALQDAKGGASDGVVTEATTALTNAAEQRDAAKTSRSSGIDLQNQVENAGSELVIAVDRIDNAVFRGVHEAQPSLESLSGIISQLAKASSIFAPNLGLEARIAAYFPKPAPQGEKVGGKDEAIKIAMDNLAIASNHLSNAAKVVQAKVESFAATRPLETLKGCGVNLADIPLDIQVAPASLSFVAGTALRQAVIITGGTPPYVGRFTVSPTPGLSIENPLPNDHALWVVGDGSTKAMASLNLDVVDAAGHRKTIAVAVQDNQSVGKPAPVSGDNAGAKNTKLLTEAQKKELQDLQSSLDSKSFSTDEGKFTFDLCAINSTSGKVECAIKTEGGKAVTEFKNPTSVVAAIGGIATADGGLVVKDAFPAFASELTIPGLGTLSAQAAHVSKYGPVAAKLTGNEVTRLQIALCMSATELDGKWGERTQLAYEAWKNQRVLLNEGARDQLFATLPKTTCK